ncbi:MAG: hypothetical protein AAGH70_14280 [Pseudomonadota bacterium]
MIGEATVYSLELILPALVLVAVAWIVPTWLGKRLPETMLALGANLAVSAFIIWVFAALAFATSYALQGVPVRALIDGTQHFAGLGRASVLFWGPILLLAIVMQPQKWRPDL